MILIPNRVNRTEPRPDNGGVAVAMSGPRPIVNKQHPAYSRMVGRFWAGSLGANASASESVDQSFEVGPMALSGLGDPVMNAAYTGGGLVATRRGMALQNSQSSFAQHGINGLDVVRGGDATGIGALAVFGSVQSAYRLTNYVFQCGDRGMTLFADGAVGWRVASGDRYKTEAGQFPFNEPFTLASMYTGSNNANGGNRIVSVDGGVSPSVIDTHNYTFGFNWQFLMDGSGNHGLLGSLIAFAMFSYLSAGEVTSLSANPKAFFPRLLA